MGCDTQDGTEREGLDTHPGFSEQTLRQAIVNTWGPAGAHVEVFDALLAALGRAEAERDRWKGSADSIARTLNDACTWSNAVEARLAAAEAVVEAAEQGYARSEVCGSCDAGLPMNCTCNPMDDALATYRKTTGSQQEAKDG